MEAQEGASKTAQTPFSVHTAPAHTPGALFFPQPTASTISKRIKITANNGRPLLGLDPQKKRKLEETSEQGNDHRGLPGSENDPVQEHGQRKPIKTRPVKSKLHLLVAMPLDILFEIFGHLGPYDVLLLSRTTKAFRQVLFQRHATSVWRSAIGNSPELPSCPEDISLPAWINLAFSAHCHNCLAPSVHNIYWVLRIRLCKKCGKKCLLPEKTVKTAYKQVFDLIISCVPFVDDYGIKSCLIEAPKAFLAEIDVTGSDRNNIINRRKLELEKNLKHARECKNWDNARVRNRLDVLQKLKATRRNAIIKHLEELGYGEEVNYAQHLRWSNSGSLLPFNDHNLVNQNRPLTPRIWANIKGDMVEYMGKVKIALAEMDRKNVLKGRNEAALVAWNSYLRSQPSERLYPSPMNVLEWPPFRSILSQDISIPVSSESFTLALARIPNFIKQMYECQIEEVYYSAYKPMNLIFSLDLQTKLEHLKLAVCVFKCEDFAHHMLLKGHNFPFYCEEMVSWMWFPEFMAHGCNSVAIERFTDKFDEIKDLRIPGEYHDCKRRRWSADKLIFDVKASNVVQAVVTTCGKDWKTTSAKDMDDLDARVVCLKCSYGFKCDGERIMSVYTWRRAVIHSMEKHWGDSRVTWERILEADVAVAKIEEADLSDNIDVEKKWRCSWCRDTNNQVGRMSAPLMRRHYRLKHPNVTMPLQQGTHFYRAMDWTPQQPPSVRITPKKVPLSDGVST